MKKNLLSVLLVLSCALGLKAQLLINEYSCSNLTQYVDNHSDYNDWFEIYNAGASVVNLGGYYLSDDSLVNNKYVIPSTVTIAPNGFIRVWASGRNEVVLPHIHVNFKLTQTKKNSEFIVLSDPTGVILDYVKLTKLTKNGHSRGRKPDGSATWGVFTVPTPNSTNNNALQYIRYADKPDFNMNGGYFAAAQTITITTNDSNAVIRYTTDGSEPTNASTVYTAPVSISTTKVLKAITYTTNQGVLPSFIEYQTYFINVSHTLPIVSVSATSLTSLANGNGNLEPTGSFELYDTTGNRVGHSYGEFNRHGQDSWVLSQRSLDFISRDEHGYTDAIREQVFIDSPRDSYQRLILRAAGDDNYPADFNSANAGSAHLRDAYIHTLAIRGGMNLDVRRATKVVVYINGQYWGVYDIRDNPDDHDNTKFYYGQDKFNLQFIETWGNTWSQYGGQASLTDYSQLRSYILNSSNNFSDPAKYQYVYDQYDVTSLVDYVIANTFTVCTDWLNYNTGWWRGMDSTGTHLKWGYILWDNDATFDHYINYTNVPGTQYNSDPCDVENSSQVSDPQFHIDILNKLRQNPGFNQYYISRQIDMWNTVWSCSNMLAEFDSVAAVIDPEMAAHATRWGGTYAGWVANKNTLRQFIEDRCNWMQNGFINCYQLTGPYDITITANPTNGGSIDFNTLKHTQLPFTGKYFGGMDNKFHIDPNPGYTFANWTANVNTINPINTSVDITVNPTAADTITAHLTFGIGFLEHEGSVPHMSALPSVFNSATTVEYYLPENASVNIRIFNNLGIEVATLVNNIEMAKGNYMANVDFSRTQLPAGVYYVQMIAGDNKAETKLMYVK